MSTPGPSAEVSQPDLVEAAVGTLLATFEPVDTEDDRWELGYHFATWGSCISAFRWGPCSGVYKTPGTGSTTVETQPVTVYSPFRCSTFGFNQDEYVDAAKDGLRFMGSSQLEAELWDGRIAQANGWPNRYLTDGNATAADGTGGGGQLYPWPGALAVLQGALRRCSGNVAGVIHASPTVVGMWMQTGAVFERDGKLRDFFGNYVIGGGGYSGNAAGSARIEIFSDPAPSSGAYTVEFTPEGMAPFTVEDIPFDATASEIEALIVAAIEAAGYSPQDGDVSVQAGGAGVFTVNMGGQFTQVPFAVAVTEQSTDVEMSATVTDQGGEIEVWGEEYAFATDLIDVRVGPTQVIGEDTLHEALRRDINEVELIAEASMSAAWARCCHLVVRVALNDACSWPDDPADG